MKPRRRAGILLGRDSAGAVLAQQTRKGPPRVITTTEAKIDAGVWDTATPDFTDVMMALAKGLGPAARRADVPAAISLPDPLVSEEHLTFKDIPTDQDEIHELVAWRIARDRRCKAEDISVAFQKIATSDAGTEFLVRVLPAHVRDAILSAAVNAGFTVSHLEGFSRFMEPSVMASETQDDAVMDAFIIEVSGTLSTLCHMPGTAQSHVHAQWISAPDANGSAARVVRVLKSVGLTQAVSGTRVVIEASNRLAAEIDAAIRSNGIALIAPPQLRRKRSLRDAAVTVAGVR